MKTARSQFRADAANPFATAILQRDRADRNAWVERDIAMQQERARFWRSINVLGAILSCSLCAFLLTSGVF